MPRLPIDYSRTIIYKLVCKDLTIKDCYVGATTDFNKRKYNHKSNCNNKNSKQYHINVYQFIRDNGGFDNWNMIMVEEYSCDNKLQSDTRERYWTETLGATLNINVVGRTLKEYYDANKVGIIEYQKIYRENNKEENVVKDKKYYEANKDDIIKKAKIYYEANKDDIIKKVKEYYEKNKEKIIEYQKIHRENNKEELSKKKKIYNEANRAIIAEKAKAKITCNCGSVICKSDKSKHNKTIKHINYLSTL